MLILLLCVIACACICSLKKAAENARKDRVVTIIGNIEYFNNSSPTNTKNQISLQNNVANQLSSEREPIKI